MAEWWSWLNPISAIDNLFEGEEKQQSQVNLPQNDALASIRQRLQEIASGVSGIKESRAESIRKTFGSARERGLGDIKENIYAKRGLGETSIEPMYNLRFLSELGAKEESALSENEARMAALEAQLLGKAGSLATGEMGDYSDILSSYEDYEDYEQPTSQFPLFEKILKGKIDEMTEQDWIQEFKNLPSYITAISA